MTAEADVVRGTSRLGTILGLTTVIIGILAMTTPVIPGLAVTVVIGALLVAAGVAKSAYAFSAGSFWKGLFQFLFGGITALAGVVGTRATAPGIGDHHDGAGGLFPGGRAYCHPARLPSETDQGMGLDGVRRHRGRRFQRFDLARLAALRGVGRGHPGRCASGDVGVGHDRVGRCR